MIEKTCVLLPSAKIVAVRNIIQMNFLASAQGNAKVQEPITKKYLKMKSENGNNQTGRKITLFQYKEAHEIVPADWFLTFVFLNFVLASFL